MDCGIENSRQMSQTRMDDNMQISNTLGYSKMALHINNPDLDDVWLEGFEAAGQSQDEMTNPYLATDIAHEFWDQGWWAGFYGEQPDLSAKTTAADQTTDKTSNVLWQCFQSTLHTMEKMVCASLASLMVYEILFTVS